MGCCPGDLWAPKQPWDLLKLQRLLRWLAPRPRWEHVGWKYWIIPSSADYQCQGKSPIPLVPRETEFSRGLLHVCFTSEASGVGKTYSWKLLAVAAFSFLFFLITKGILSVQLTMLSRSISLYIFIFSSSLFGPLIMTANMDIFLCTDTVLSEVSTLFDFADMEMEALCA